MDVAGTVPDSRRREQTDGYGIPEIDDAGKRPGFLIGE
jgi:hypothetical protein